LHALKFLIFIACEWKSVVGEVGTCPHPDRHYYNALLKEEYYKSSTSLRFQTFLCVAIWTRNWTSRPPPPLDHRFIYVIYLTYWFCPLPNPTFPFSRWNESCDTYFLGSRRV